MFQIQWRKKVLMETFLTWKSLWSVLSLAEPRFFDATDRPLPAAWKKIDKKLFLEFEKDNGDDIAEQKIEFHSWKENECKLCEREIERVRVKWGEERKKHQERERKREWERNREKKKEKQI